MSKEMIVGHEVIENGQYIMVVQRSERPLGGLAGFIFGTLISLIFSQEIPEIHMISIILIATLLGYIFSKGQSTREVLKQRVIKITRKRNYVAVYYVIHDSPLMELTS